MRTSPSMCRWPSSSWRWPAEPEAGLAGGRDLRRRQREDPCARECSGDGGGASNEDHVALSFTALDDTCAALRAGGQAFVVEPRDYRGAARPTYAIPTAGWSSRSGRGAFGDMFDCAVERRRSFSRRTRKVSSGNRTITSPWSWVAAATADCTVPDDRVSPRRAPETRAVTSPGRLTRATWTFVRLGNARASPAADRSGRRVRVSEHDGARVADCNRDERHAVDGLSVPTSTSPRSCLELTVSRKRARTMRRCLRPRRSFARLRREPGSRDAASRSRRVPHGSRQDSNRDVHVPGDVPRISSTPSQTGRKRRCQGRVERLVTGSTTTYVLPSARHVEDRIHAPAQESGRR